MSVAARTGDERALVAAARAGDEDAFAVLVQPYRRELHVHAYRLLGSVHDAEDALQETLLRAWRLLDGFEARAPFRAWLYRIATNVCLTALARRRSRADVTAPRFEVELPPGEEGDVVHLTPYPDHRLEELAGLELGPEARYERRESVELAFVAAVQLLPPRQRAVLALRDVLGFSASEVADLLETSVAGVTSALQRARERLARERAAGRLGRAHAPASADGERALVQAYVDAWEAGDVDRVVGLLAEDALLTMPPLPLRYVGRGPIGAFFATVPGPLDRIRLVSTRANGQPALAAYIHDPLAGVHRAYGVMVLSMRGEEIAAITGFGDPTLAAQFGLPAELPA